jgi:hypothetical protein
MTENKIDDYYANITSKQDSDDKKSNSKPKIKVKKKIVKKVVKKKEETSANSSSDAILDDKKEGIKPKKVVQKINVIKRSNDLSTKDDQVDNKERKKIVVIKKSDRVKSD